MQAVADARKFFQLSAGEKKKGRYDLTVGRWATSIILW